MHPKMLDDTIPSWLLNVKKPTAAQLRECATQLDPVLARSDPDKALHKAAEFIIRSAKIEGNWQKEIHLFALLETIRRPKESILSVHREEENSSFQEWLRTHATAEGRNSK